MTAEHNSDRGLTPYTDPPTASRPSAPVPLSRLGSRSTITFTTDAATAVAVDRMTQRTSEQPDQDDSLDPGPSRRNLKRTRSSLSEGDDGDDGDNDGDDNDSEYLPHKRARLSRPATRGVRAVRKLFTHVVAALNTHYRVGTIDGISGQ